MRAHVFYSMWKSSSPSRTPMVIVAPSAVAATEELSQAATELAFEGFIDSLGKATIVLEGLQAVAESLEGDDPDLETVIGMIKTIEETLKNLEQANE